MPKTKKKDIKKIIGIRRNEIQNYIYSLFAMLSLRKFVIEEMKGNFFFGGKITDSNNNQQTPDIIAKFGECVWIGEVKKSLSSPESYPTKEEYIKKYIEGDIIKHLKKYDQKFNEINIKHELIFMLPKFFNDAISVLRFDYLKNKEDLFEHSFALLVFSLFEGGTGRFILIELEDGDLKNATAKDLLMRGYKKAISEIKGDLAKFKVYEENTNTPLEYLMYILWVNIFPEIMKKNSMDRIIEWLDQRKNIFEVKLSELMNYLHKMYTLPSFSGDRKQFRTDLVIKAMKNFEKMGYVQVISEGNEYKFKVTYKTLPEKREIDYIIKKLYSEEDIAEEQTASSTNLTKWFH